VACYHDGMDRKITTVRLPEDLAETAEVVARGKGVSVNALIVEALAAEIDRVKADGEFMASLRALTERDREILDRLAE
jgi:glutamate-1-semialdehyde aminotransferase